MSALGYNATTVSLPSWLTLVTTKHTDIVSTRDGSLLANAYGSAPTDGQRALVGPDWPTKYQGKILPKYRVFVVEADAAAPSTWKYRATVAFDVTNELEHASNPAWNKTNPPQANFTKNHRPPANAKHEGFTESYITATTSQDGQPDDDRVIAVMRTGYTLYRALSVDGGRHWGNVDPISPNYGISGGTFYAPGGSQYASPHVLTLPNGIVAVVTGRPAAYVLFSADRGDSFVGPWCFSMIVSCTRRLVGDARIQYWRGCGQRHTADDLHHAERRCGPRRAK